MQLYPHPLPQGYWYQHVQVNTRYFPCAHPHTSSGLNISSSPCWTAWLTLVQLHKLHCGIRLSSSLTFLSLGIACIKTPSLMPCLIFLLVLTLYGSKFQHPVKHPLLDGLCAQTGSMYPAVNTTLYAEPGSRHPVEHHVKLPPLVRTLDQGIQLNIMLNSLSLCRHWIKASSWTSC